MNWSHEVHGIGQETEDNCTYRRDEGLDILICIAEDDSSPQKSGSSHLRVGKYSFSTAILAVSPSFLDYMQEESSAYYI